MKKFLCILLAVLLCLPLLAACGSKKSETPAGNTDTQATDDNGDAAAAAAAKAAAEQADIVICDAMQITDSGTARMDYSARDLSVPAMIMTSLPTRQFVTRLFSLEFPSLKPTMPPT